MWDLPRPGLEPVSPALAGGFLTTVPPGKSWWRRIWTEALAGFCWLRPKGGAVPGWGMAGPRQRCDCSTGRRRRCWGFWQTQAHQATCLLFCSLTASLPRTTRMSVQKDSLRKAGLAWCSPAPEWAKLICFLPSVKSALLWIQVEVWEFLATSGWKFAVITTWDTTSRLYFQTESSPLKACLARAGQTGAGDTRGVCHLWWRLRRVSAEQQGLRRYHTAEVPGSAAGSACGLVPPFLGHLDVVSQQQASDDRPYCWAGTVRLHPVSLSSWCYLRHI